MSYPSGNNSQNKFSLESLIQKNSQTMENLELEPYKPIIYAIPENQRKLEMELLQQAVATLEQLAAHLKTMERTEQVLLQKLLSENKDTVANLKHSISQAGKNLENTTSEISELLAKNRGEISSLVTNLHRKITRLLITTSMLSVLVSALVCVAWQAWGI